MYFDIKQPRRSATLLAAVSQYENSTSCVMLLPICSSVVVVTDSASAPLFSLALLLSHQLKPPTAAVYLRAIHPLAGGGGLLVFWSKLLLVRPFLRCRARKSDASPG